MIILSCYSERKCAKLSVIILRVKQQITLTDIFPHYWSKSEHPLLVSCKLGTNNSLEIQHSSMLVTLRCGHISFDNYLFLYTLLPYAYYSGDYASFYTYKVQWKTEEIYYLKNKTSSNERDSMRVKSSQHRHFSLESNLTLTLMDAG